MGRLVQLSGACGVGGDREASYPKPHCPTPLNRPKTQHQSQRSTLHAILHTSNQCYCRMLCSLKVWHKDLLVVICGCKRALRHDLDAHVQAHTEARLRCTRLPPSPHFLAFFAFGSALAAAFCCLLASFSSFSSCCLRLCKYLKASRCCFTWSSRCLKTDIATW